MARLIYSAIASLDGFVEDVRGEFDWSAPDDEVLSFINGLERPVGTYLYGRRMYETMQYWETAPLGDGVPSVLREFTQIWHGAEKIVYSRTLESVSTARTRVERTFDGDAIRRLKLMSSDDLTVGGADLARQAIEAQVVDELQLFVVPVVVGGGKPWLPKGVHLSLELLDVHTFASGVVFLRYRPDHSGAGSAERATPG
jgi:dihydrofolate reductase